MGNGILVLKTLVSCRTMERSVYVPSSATVWPPLQSCRCGEPFPTGRRNAWEGGWQRRLHGCASKCFLCCCSFRFSLPFLKERFHACKASAILLLAQPSIQYLNIYTWNWRFLPFVSKLGALFEVLTKLAVSFFWRFWWSEGTVQWNKHIYPLTESCVNIKAFLSFDLTCNW